MSSSTHPVEREELMAYFDGELPVERAAAVAEHLRQCADCTVLAADLGSVSEQLSAWHVEPSPQRLTQRLTAAQAIAPKIPLEPAAKKVEPVYVKPRNRLVRVWVLGLAGVAVLFLLLAAVLTPNLLRSRFFNPVREAAEQTPSGEGTVNYSLGDHRDQGEFATKLSTLDLARAQRAGGSGGGGDRSPTPETSSSVRGPMIVRTARLTLVSKEFDKTRAAIEGVVRQHQGYMAQLAVASQPGAGRVLTATVRVPAGHLDGALTELKKLGQVEQESQGGNEVTRQYVDLVARLSNARQTEQRLIDVLRERTGKVADVLNVEREIDRVRGEIESMAAERVTLENQVQLATLQLQLSEEYKAQLEVAPGAAGTRLYNAAVDGYRAAVAGVLAVMLFLLSYGPSLLLWGLVFFWPARVAWRLLRPWAEKAP